MAFLLCASCCAFAGGFQVSLQGQKQTGMGHTGVGTNLDYASIYFNPGALSLFKRNGFSVGFSPIFSEIGYLEPTPGTYTAFMNNDVGTPFSGYLGIGCKDQSKAISKFKFGLGVYTPFGSGSKWEDDWKGNHVVQSVDLSTVFIQPTVSYAITEKLGIGIGGIYGIGNVNLRRALPFQTGTTNYGQAELDGAGTGFGFNAGVFYQATDDLSIGLNYKSEVKFKVDDGDAIFTDVPASLMASFPNTKFASEIVLPQIISGGLGYQVTEKLLLALDINYTGWSSYDTLKFDYVDNTSALTDTRSTKEWENTLTFRLGGNYNFSEKFAARAGVVYDQGAAIEDYVAPETPDNDRIALTAGLTYKPIDRLEIDGSFMYVEVAEFTAINQETNFGGTFKTKVVIPGIGVTYHFGAAQKKDRDNDGVADKDDPCPDVAGNRAGDGCPDTDMDGVPDNLDNCPTIKGLATLRGCPEEKELNIQDIDKEILQYSRSINFETGSAVIKSESYGVLESILKIMNKYSANFLIEGHTDNTGGDYNNMALSQKRASSVLTYFVNKGIDSNRLKAIGYGETKPMADNSTAEGRAQNRRVIIKINTQ